MDEKTDNPGGEYAGEKSKTDSTAGGFGTAGAPAKHETEATDRAAQLATGFQPFYRWANQQIRRGETRLYHNSEPCEVTELTPDGQIRLKVGDSFALVNFDDTNIVVLLRQWL